MEPLKSNVLSLFIEKRKNLWIALLLFVFCLITYGNVFHHEFLLDDYPMLIQNREIDSLSFLQLNPQLLHSQIYFRPISHLLNFITYSFFDHHPAGYHAVNLALFYLCAVAIYDLFRALFKQEQVVLLACILFCMHPINGVLVNYKNATGYSLMTLSFLMSLKYFASSGRYFLNNVLGCIWLTLSLLCHEIVAVYPLYLICLLVYGRQLPFKEVLRKSFPSLVVVLIYLTYRTIYLKGGIALFDSLQLFHLSWTEFLAAYSRIIFWYVNKILFAQHIVLIFDIPLDAQNILLWLSLLILSLIGSLYFIFRKSFQGMSSLGVAWVWTGFIPVLLACVSRPNLGFIIEPHWLIFSSIGFFILIASMLVQIKKKLNIRLFQMLMAGICCYYMGQSLYHNYLWGKQERYCKYWLSISPNNTMPNFWLAFEYMQQKEYVKARQIYENLLKKVNVDSEVFGNMGICELKLNNYQLALTYFYRSLELSPNVVDTLFYIGESYFYLGNYAEAETYLKKALYVDSRVIPASELLWRIYKDQGRYAEADQVYKTILRWDPNIAEIRQGVVN